MPFRWWLFFTLPSTSSLNDRLFSIFHSRLHLLPAQYQLILQRRKKSNALYSIAIHRCGAAYHHTHANENREESTRFLATAAAGEKLYFNTICPLGVHKTRRRIVKLFYSTAAGKRRSATDVSMCAVLARDVASCPHSPSQFRDSFVLLQITIREGFEVNAAPFAICNWQAQTFLPHTQSGGFFICADNLFYRVWVWLGRSIATSLGHFWRRVDELVMRNVLFYWNLTTIGCVGYGSQVDRFVKGGIGQSLQYLQDCAIVHDNSDFL